MKTNLYVGGCSWAWGDELNDPDKSAWPVLFAEKMNMNLIHKGACGNSNQGIWLGLNGLLTTNYVDGWSNEKYDLNDVFVILQWSFPVRSVMTINTDLLGEPWKSDIKLEYLDMPISPGHTGRYFYKLDIFKNDVKFWKRRWEEWVYVEFNRSSMARKSLFYMVSCLSMLEFLNIPYISLWGPVLKVPPFFSDEEWWVEHESLNKYNHLHIDQSFASYLNQFSDIEYGSGLHPLELGHKRWADHVYKLINDN